MLNIGLFLPLITAFAYLLSALRLVCYQRGAARFRRSISLLASLFGAALCLNGLEILLYRPPVSLWHTIAIVLLCALIFRSRGNLAALLRPHS
ncbi:phage holin family protein [Pseudomonas agarici]|uniref:phage holin family protein n=1 Tax=Pseudomonas agarici TaxID=46677 RepID=UPI0015A365E9|nr:phage holin family protein [Pseudomonas agarici]NWB91600.1 phage holin family protein [Pseudomonas agarici]